MSQNEYQTPATLALAEFLQRIDQDDGLTAAIKKAVHDDLAAGGFASFDNLTAALAAETNKK
jgi:hypothetical protein